MEKYEKIQLETLLDRKERLLQARKAPEKKELYVKSLNGTIVIERPSLSLCTDAAKMEGEAADAYMVYQCVKEPNLKSDELREAFGVSDPLDVVQAIFLPGEISGIAAECIVLAGYGSSVRAIKN